MYVQSDFSKPVVLAGRQPAVTAGGWTFVIGLRPVDLKNPQAPLPDGLEGQAATVLANCDALLKDAGLTRDHVVSVRISLVEFPRFYERLMAVLDGFFPASNGPTLTCVGVTHLERGALVELEFAASAAKTV